MVAHGLMCFLNSTYVSGVYVYVVYVTAHGCKSVIHMSDVRQCNSNGTFMAALNLRNQQTLRRKICSPNTKP